MCIRDRSYRDQCVSVVTKPADAGAGEMA
jgi:hypothetical protein